MANLQVSVTYMEHVPQFEREPLKSFARMVTKTVANTEMPGDVIMKGITLTMNGQLLCDMPFDGMARMSTAIDTAREYNRGYVDGRKQGRKDMRKAMRKLLGLKK